MGGVFVAAKPSAVQPLAVLHGDLAKPRRGGDWCSMRSVR